MGYDSQQFDFHLEYITTKSHKLQVQDWDNPKFLNLAILYINMSLSNVLQENLKSIIEIARLAPSVHNTQPWQISIDNDKLYIDIDPRYQLSDGDPTGRETIISLGIFAEAIKVASEQFGLQCRNISLDKYRAVIHFTLDKSKKNSQEVNALKTRVTDRSIYSQVDINQKIKSTIVNVAPNDKAKVWVLTDAKSINIIASLTSKGISLALSNPSFRQELSRYLVLPWSSKKRGISTSSLYLPKALEICEPFLMKLGIGIKSEAKLERKRWESASGVIFITTKGDMSEYWFEAGRAYLRVALEIEQLGLSQATSAATVEASNYHEDVEQLIGTNQRLQCVIRVGKGASKRNHSPRVSAEEIIT